MALNEKQRKEEVKGYDEKSSGQEKRSLYDRFDDD